MLSFLATAIWTIDAILKLASPSDPQIRPDGTGLAYVYRGAIYTQALKTDATPSQIERGSRPRWSPDSKRLAFLNDGQVHVQDITAGGTKVVTHSATPVNSYMWSPNGQQIAYLANDPSKPEDPIIAGQTRWYSRLYLQPISGGDAKLITKANRHVVVLRALAGLHARCICRAAFTS